jgi:hypothetical protein
VKTSAGAALSKTAQAQVCTMHAAGPTADNWYKYDAASHHGLQAIISLQSSSKLSCAQIAVTSMSFCICLQPSSPGPGQYTLPAALCLGRQGPAFTMGARPAAQQLDNRVPASVPGPGAYGSSRWALLVLLCLQQLLNTDVHQPSSKCPHVYLITLCSCQQACMSCFTHGNCTSSSWHVARE